MGGGHATAATAAAALTGAEGAEDLGGGGPRAAAPGSGSRTRAVLTLIRRDCGAGGAPTAIAAVAAVAAAGRGMARQDFDGGRAPPRKAAAAGG